jgi:uncharacterized protein (TIGR02598 family)
MMQLSAAADSMRSPSNIISRRPRQPLQGGFSLVEVTLAVAIAALAIITLLGLLPQGLEMSRKTGLITSNSYILEQIVRDLENAQWANIPVTKVRKYYSDQGTEVAQNSKKITFVAEIDYTRTASLPQKATTQPYLRRVVVQVANSGSADFEFGTQNRASYSTFNQLVAKTR